MITDEEIESLINVLPYHSELITGRNKESIEKLIAHYKASQLINEEIIKIRDMGGDQVELDSDDYDDVEVLKLNDQSIDIYFALDKLVKKISGSVFTTPPEDK